ncbi:MAG: molybdenum cofactor biosynthesis protein MoaE [Rhodospirillaceae bacterium]|nr:molybdenum cofactor biosynthesis protein MoaE [Rhodospirillaceae bacterium]
MIKIQKTDFDISVELKLLTTGNINIGGVASFVGLVRENSDGEEILTMTLEHYPGMTEKILQKLECEALDRWSLENLLIIHRYGELNPGDQIVLVITTSAHRSAAFESCQFLIDRLKNGAPFWKKEKTVRGTRWVEAKEEDREADERWQNIIKY